MWLPRMPPRWVAPQEITNEHTYYLPQGTEQLLPVTDCLRGNVLFRGDHGLFLLCIRGVVCHIQHSKLDARTERADERERPDDPALAVEPGGDRAVFHPHYHDAPVR